MIYIVIGIISLLLAVYCWMSVTERNIRKWEDDR